MDAASREPGAQDRWARLESLFHAALALEPSEHLAFLRDACGDDIALAAEVAALLRADDSSPQDFEHWPAHAAAARSSAEATPDFGGRTLAHYQILRPLGAGGMG
jgi:eukaryotic-like serine/threonine-protein kinase